MLRLGLGGFGGFCIVGGGCSCSGLLGCVEVNLTLCRYMGTHGFGYCCFHHLGLLLCGLFGLLLGRALVLSVLHQFLGFAAQFLVGAEFLLEEFVLLVGNLLIQIFFGDGTTFFLKEIGNGREADTEFFDNFIESDIHAVFWSFL